MKKNMGSLDRIIRSFIGVLIFALIPSGIINGITGILFITLASIFIITSVLGFCPLYKLLHIQTTPKGDY
jgi:hypothetical protein